MAPTLTCVRHGQGYHNLGAKYHHLVDPSLTNIGEEQCKAVEEKCTRLGRDISLIIASPLTRTLQTALFSFESVLSTRDGQMNILALPSAQETFDYPFNTGTETEQLRDKCKENNWPVDLSLVEEGWTDKSVQSRYYPASIRLEARARDTRQFVRTKLRELLAAGVKDPHIVLVTHGSFLHFFTEDFENYAKGRGTGWDNCECRAYTFENGVDTDDDLEAHLVETSKSRQERGVAIPAPSREEQRDLFQKAIVAWEQQQLPNAIHLGYNIPASENVNGSKENAN